jgi:hypothetical protein
MLWASRWGPGVASEGHAPNNLPQALNCLQRYCQKNGLGGLPQFFPPVEDSVKVSVKFVERRIHVHRLKEVCL